MLNVSALTSALFKVNEYIDKDSKGDLSNKEALNILFRDYELSMSGGNIFKFLKKFIVQPTIFISKDLEGTPYEVDAINAQLNVFTAFYIQAVKIMTDHYQIDTISAINLLKTDRGEIGNALVANGSRLIQHLDKGLESDFDANLKRFAGYNVKKVIRRYEDDIHAKKVKLENDRLEIESANHNEIVAKLSRAFNDVGIKIENDDLYSGLKANGIIYGINKDNVEQIVDAIYKEEADLRRVDISKMKPVDQVNYTAQKISGIVDDVGDIHKQTYFIDKKIDSINYEVNALKGNISDVKKGVSKEIDGVKSGLDTHSKKMSKEISALKSFFKNNNKEERSKVIANYTTVERAASDKILEEAGKSPTYNYYLRNFDITVQMINDKASTVYKVVIPITVHAHILYVDTETIDSHIASSNSNDDNSIFTQWNDFRIGAKSFWDVAVANTLVKNYRKNLLKDTEGLLSELEQHNKNAKVRLLTTGKAQGFEKYYNLFILSSETIKQLSKKVGDLKNSTNKDKFMEMLGSQQLLIMDYEYELFYFYMLNIDGESKGKLNSLTKMDKKKDNDDILSALMANSVPRI